LASNPCPKDDKFTPGSGSRSGTSAPTNLDHPSAARSAAAKLERVWIRFEVQDNGVGITPEDQVRLFTAFHQIQAGALQKGGGSGLGLSICKEIVRRHGGAVGVQSVPDQGSTFFAEVSCIPVGSC
jgi:signal transduction histidine kinase